MSTEDAEIKALQAASESRVVKVIFPNNTNHHDTLFGGDALSWMDETAFIAATRFCRKQLVTVSSDRIDFKHPIPAGSIVELVGRVERVGRTSLTVAVDVFVEDMYADERHRAISGSFTMVAVDESMQPIAVLEPGHVQQP